MVEGFEIIEGVSRYLRQDINSRVFRDWMVSVQLQREAECSAELSKVDAEKAEVSENLLSAIDALYAQFADGYLPEQSMRQELAKLVLSERTQTQSVTLFYSFLRPLFGSPLENREREESETSTERSNASARTRTVPAAA